MEYDFNILKHIICVNYTEYIICDVYFVNIIGDEIATYIKYYDKDSPYAILKSERIKIPISTYKNESRKLKLNKLKRLLNGS